MEASYGAHKKAIEPKAAEDSSAGFGRGNVFGYGRRRISNNDCADNGCFFAKNQSGNYAARRGAF
jgi:hypothetical protein